MNVKANSVKFLDGVKLEVTYIDGKVILFDMSSMYKKYPQLKALENRELFESGHLDVGGYGIVWNNELDFDAQSIYESGKLVNVVPTNINEQLGYQIAKAREVRNMTQSELAKLSGVDQADISKLERGQGNPSAQKIEKILHGLNASIKITIT
ncbi:MAG: DUF2442 domain-containing protein [Bacilli bacterium]|nr:DUF2442 domain-containing protein [Bacilli bacterium]